MEDEASEQSQLIIKEAQNDNQGGWITFPFIMGSMLGLWLSHSGALGNFMVYLIREYNVKSIDAAQIGNIINGCISIAPVAGAVVTDAFFGCYPVIVFSTIISLLSTILFTLTAALPTLRPAPCAFASDACEPSSAAQLAFLYTAVALLAVSSGGTRFNTITMAASQFDRTEDRDVVFNWFFILQYVSAIVGSTAIVFIEDSISWTWGFGLSAALNAISVVVLLVGGKYYRRPAAAQGNPFTVLARVVVATIKKWNVKVSPEGKNYYHGTCEIDNASNLNPSQTFSCMNCAAWICHGDTGLDGSIAKPWSLCSVQQVEDFKELIRVLPLWTTSILLSVSIGMQFTLTGLQALTMDRSLGRLGFSLPVGSMLISSFAATTLALVFLDRLLFPLWRTLARRAPTTLQCIGLGHVVNVAAMAASALVERERARVVRSHDAESQADWVVPMSALWLLLPLAVAGVAEALHFPAQVALYYGAFPGSLRNTATGMVALIVALGFYLSSAVIDLVRRVTGWLPDNINASKMETVYWVMTVTTLANFGYYVSCAMLYKDHSVPEEEDGDNVA